MEKKSSSENKEADVNSNDQDIKCSNKGKKRSFCFKYLYIPLFKKRYINSYPRLLGKFIGTIITLLILWVLVSKLNFLKLPCLFSGVKNLVTPQILCWVSIGFFLASARSIINDCKVRGYVFPDRRIIDLFPTYLINYPFSILVSALIIDHLIPAFFDKNSVITHIEAQITLALIFGFFIDNVFINLPNLFKK
jgi:hypothetical protein